MKDVKGWVSHADGWETEYDDKIVGVYPLKGSDDDYRVYLDGEFWFSYSVSRFVMRTDDTERYQVAWGSSSFEAMARSMLADMLRQGLK